MKYRALVIAFALLVLGMGVALAGQVALPNHALTPGLADPRLTKALICGRGFSTKRYRRTTGSMKRKVCQEYHIKQRCPGPGQEIDHLIALTDGGADDVRNLWPQPYTVPGAHQKDVLENKLHKMICAGQIQLLAAQACLVTNWYDCYKRYAR